MTLYHGALATGQNSAVLTKDTTSHPCTKTQNIQAYKTRQLAAPEAKEVKIANHDRVWTGPMAQWVTLLTKPGDLS